MHGKPLCWLPMIRPHELPSHSSGEHPGGRYTACCLWSPSHVMPASSQAPLLFACAHMLNGSSTSFHVDLVCIPCGRCLTSWSQRNKLARLLYTRSGTLPLEPALTVCNV